MGGVLKVKRLEKKKQTNHFSKVFQAVESSTVAWTGGCAAREAQREVLAYKALANSSLGPFLPKFYGLKTPGCVREFRCPKSKPLFWICEATFVCKAAFVHVCHI